MLRVSLAALRVSLPVFPAKLTPLLLQERVFAIVVSFGELIRISATPALPPVPPAWARQLAANLANPELH